MCAAGSETSTNKRCTLSLVLWRDTQFDQQNRAIVFLGECLFLSSPDTLKPLHNKSKLTGRSLNVDFAIICTHYLFDCPANGLRLTYSAKEIRNAVLCILAVCFQGTIFFLANFFSPIYVLAMFSQLFHLHFVFTVTLTIQR